MSLAVVGSGDGALKSSVAASQAQGAVKKAQSELVSGSVDVWALRVERRNYWTAS